jgi:hypothetical protein
MIICSIFSAFRWSKSAARARLRGYLHVFATPSEILGLVQTVSKPSSLKVHLSNPNNLRVRTGEAFPERVEAFPEKARSYVHPGIVAESLWFQTPSSFYDSIGGVRAGV